MSPPGSHWGCDSLSILCLQVGPVPSVAASRGLRQGGTAVAPLALSLMRSTVLAILLLIPPLAGCAHAESETEARPWGALGGAGGGPSRPPQAGGGAGDDSVLRDAADPGEWPDVGTRDVAATGGAAGDPASGGNGGSSTGGTNDDAGPTGGTGGSSTGGSAGTGGGTGGPGGAAGASGMGGSGGAIPTSWACRVEYYDEGVVGYCDCGCGAPDPDCAGGCTDPGCSDPACDYCHDQGGADVACVGGSVWMCPPQHYGEGSPQYCDCGCGKPDPDCGGGGCTDPACYDSACMYCHAVSGAEIPCGP
jgi:hypothetical protein